MSDDVRHTGLTLSVAEVDMVRAHLREHVPNMKCDACSSSSWTLTGPFTAWPTNRKSPGTPSGGRFLPFVVLVCNKCALMRHFALGPIWKGGPTKIYGDPYDD